MQEDVSRCMFVHVCSMFVHVCRMVRMSVGACSSMCVGGVCIKADVSRSMFVHVCSMFVRWGRMSVEACSSMW